MDWERSCNRKTPVTKPEALRKPEALENVKRKLEELGEAQTDQTARGAPMQRDDGAQSNVAVF